MKYISQNNHSKGQQKAGMGKDGEWVGFTYRNNLEVRLEGKKNGKWKIRDYIISLG